MAITKSDVLLWYDIQEGSGSTLVDANGNAGRNGTITGADWTTGGPANLPVGLDFIRGNNDIVSTNNTLTELNGSAANPFSLSFWIKWDGIGSDAGNLWNDWGNSPQRSILIRIGSGNDFEFYISDGGTVSELQLNVSGVSTSVNEHWVITRTGNNTVLYRNGAQVATNTGSFTLPASTTDIYFGNDPLTNDAFDGKWFQGIIFNRVLDLSEVQSLYNSGTGIRYEQLFEGTGDFFLLF